MGWEHGESDTVQPACVGLTPDVVGVDHPLSHRGLLPVLEGKGESHVNVSAEQESGQQWLGLPKQTVLYPKLLKALGL